MKVYFMDNLGNARRIGLSLTEEGTVKIINDFLNAHNYRSPYIRRWEEGKNIWYDVGSHSEFFVAVPCNTDDEVEQDSVIDDISFEQKEQM